MPRYGKKTDMEVFEPMMWEKEARHITRICLCDIG